MYQDNLYGDAARGCHHRGDGSDASQRTISHNRQRRGHLIDEATWRNPLGYRGGTCRRNCPSRHTRESSPPNHGTSGPYHEAKEVENDG
jgi:hypothetical protein